MSEYDFAIKDAERFVDMLQQRLTDLDVVNDERVDRKRRNSIQFDRLGKCRNGHGLGERSCAIDEHVGQSGRRNFQNRCTFRSLREEIERKATKAFSFDITFVFSLRTLLMR